MASHQMLPQCFRQAANEGGGTARSESLSQAQRCTMMKEVHSLYESVNSFIHDSKQDKHLITPSRSSTSSTVGYDLDVDLSCSAISPCLSSCPLPRPPTRCGSLSPLPPAMPCRSKRRQREAKERGDMPYTLEGSSCGCCVVTATPRANAVCSLFLCLSNDFGMRLMMPS